jgi:hypothetical protein
VAVVEPGADGLDVVSLQGHVDAAVIGPHGHRATAVGRSQPQLLASTETEMSAGRDRCLPLDRGDTTGGWRRDVHDDCGDLRIGLRDAESLGRDGDGLGCAGAEHAGRGGHIQRLVGSAVVVRVNPAVDGFLCRVQARERAHLVEQFLPQSLMPPLNLAGGGR